MRRTDREITNRREIDAIIASSEVCRLAFAVEGEPYMIPVSFGYDGRLLYFHTAKTGRKIEFIDANPRVCFEFEHDVRLRRHEDIACDWTFTFESVIGYGWVEELVDAEDKANGLNQIMTQYSGRSWSFDATSIASTRVWRIKIEKISGKRSADKGS